MTKVAIRCFAFLIVVTSHAVADDFVNLQGTVCTEPPALHCPDQDCPTALVINQGHTVEMKTRRTCFLDYPCDLKPDVVNAPEGRIRAM